MGLFALQRLMSMRRDRQQLRARNVSMASPSVAKPKRKGSPCQQGNDDGDSQASPSVAKRKASPCQQGNDDGVSHAAKIMGYSIPDPYLPEDIWRRIHSLMEMRDAAQAACVSRAFLQYWRCHPNLTLTSDVLCSDGSASTETIANRINCILRNHSGIGVKIFKLRISGIYESDIYLDSWLQFAVAPGIEELILVLYKKYNFPCSLLTDQVGNSIRHLKLDSCTFHPTTELGPFRSLTSLHLRSVRITGGELESLLSNSLALEKLELYNCNQIRFLEIPCVLQQLRCLTVFECQRLQLMENKAPNLFSVLVSTSKMIKLSFEEALQMKKLSVYRPNSVCYACTELLPIMPNLETLVLYSGEYEVVNTPMLPTKFLYLEHLNIYLTSGWTFTRSYDYFSLVSFLDACPSLETLFLNVEQERMKHVSVFGDSSHLRQIPEHHHRCLKSVEIIGFTSAKSLVELACYILKNAVSLERLTLNTLTDCLRCSENNCESCDPLSTRVLREARRAVLAIRTYIEDKVPSTVKLTVLEPCSRCHASC